MRFNIQNWIEQVKMKPDAIRYRYMLGCVTLSMFFVVIVWSLTVTENFKTADTNEVPEGQDSSLLPKASDFSLDQILSGDANLDNQQPKTGQEFLREQQTDRIRLNPTEEGLKPKDDQLVDDKDVTTQSNIVMPTLP